MCPDYTGVGKLMTDSIKADFVKRVYQSQSRSFDARKYSRDYEGKYSRCYEESLPLPTESEELRILNEINRKMDLILSHVGIPSAYILTGREVLDEFKNLNGVK